MAWKHIPGWMQRFIEISARTLPGISREIRNYETENSSLTRDLGTAISSMGRLSGEVSRKDCGMKVLNDEVGIAYKMAREAKERVVVAEAVAKQARTDRLETILKTGRQMRELNDASQELVYEILKGELAEIVRNHPEQLARVGINVQLSRKNTGQASDIEKLVRENVYLKSRMIPLGAELLAKVSKRFRVAPVAIYSPKGVEEYCSKTFSRQRLGSSKIEKLISNGAVASVLENCEEYHESIDDFDIALTPYHFSGKLIAVASYVVPSAIDKKKRAHTLQRLGGEAIQALGNLWENFKKALSDEGLGEGELVYEKT